MKSISIFARPSQYGMTKSFPRNHQIRGSSQTRGEQTSEYLGAKLNPTGGYENDICIYVKPSSLDNIKDGDYVDIVAENKGILKELFNRSGVNIITLTQLGCDYLKSKGFKNKIVTIPVFSCNYERFIRDRKEVTTVGVIGSPDSFNYPTEEFKKRMKDIGLDFITYYKFNCREDCVNFFKKIDIQVSWNKSRDLTKIFKGSIRVINAASYGIPTVALYEYHLSECNGYYIQIKTINEMVNEIKKLKDNQDYYQKWSQKLVSWAENYHIDKIAELYRKL